MTSALLALLDEAAMLTFLAIITIWHLGLWCKIVRYPAHYKG